MAENNNSFNDALKTALNNLSEIAGTDTIIGDPMTTQNGTMIIPVSERKNGFKCYNFWNCRNYLVHYDH